MKMSRGTSLGLLAVTFLVLTTAFAEDRDRDRDGGYLALGDSVAFGYINHAGYEYLNPDNFVGYPEYAGRLLHLDVVDAGCPGETTGSFISPSLFVPDLGCRDFRAKFPLHVSYSTTQLDFATNYLKTHRDTSLVTIDLGANDAFLLQLACGTGATAGDCLTSGLPAVLAGIGSNMEKILSELRGTGYRGVIVVMNYYSLDYSDATQTGFTAGINQALADAAAVHGAVIADVFSAFQKVSNVFAGHTCVAGLLNASPENATLQNPFPCDIHPSQSGAKLIGKTIAAAYAAAKGGDRD